MDGACSGPLALHSLYFTVVRGPGDWEQLVELGVSSAAQDQEGLQLVCKACHRLEISSWTRRVWYAADLHLR